MSVLPTKLSRRLEEEHLAYRVMDAEEGQREGLSWLERQFAYGWSIVSRVSRTGWSCV